MSLMSVAASLRNVARVVVIPGGHRMIRTAATVLPGSRGVPSLTIRAGL